MGLERVLSGLPTAIKLDADTIRMVEEIGRVKYGIMQRRWRTQVIKMLVREAYREMGGEVPPDTLEEEGLVE